MTEAGPALSAGIGPASPQADPIVAAVTAHDAHFLGPSRRRPVTRLGSVNDPCWERYLRMPAVIDGWPVPQCLAPVYDLSVEAQSVRTRH